MEYTIWFDESLKKGRLYSNFYGGALIDSSCRDDILAALAQKKKDLNLYGGIKWIKITEIYRNKYIEMMDLFFQFVKEGKIKIRIMFTDNRNVAKDLTPEQKENEYFILYYQFVKHAFGLMQVRHAPKTSLRINFDNLPDKKEKCNEFKEFIAGLRRHLFSHNIILDRDNISEVCSHDHDVLQCLDIVLGAMAFRLNNLHLEKIPGKRIRGKKTRAKESVYKHINKLIQGVYPNSPFNVGTSTGDRGFAAPKWEMPYRHWLFVPQNSEYDASVRMR